MRWLVAIGVLCAAAAPARAGDRPLEIVLVDAGPDDTSDPACFRTVRATFGKDEDGTHVTEVALGHLLAELRREDASAYATWHADAFAPLFHGRSTDPDAIVLVDCRPGSLDALAVAGPKAAVRFHLRASIDARAARWVARAILRRARANFVP